MNRVESQHGQSGEADLTSNSRAAERPDIRESNVSTVVPDLSIVAELLFILRLKTLSKE